MSSPAASGEDKRASKQMKMKRKNGNMVEKWEREQREKSGETLFEGFK